MALTAAQLEALATKPKSASGDTGSHSARDASEVLVLQAAADAATAAATDTAAGKVPSLWASIGKSRVVPPGAV